MTLMFRDPRTGLARGPIRYPDGRPPEPSGCRWCGRPQDTHGLALMRSGVHAWTAPTFAQILARMRARARVRAEAYRQELATLGVHLDPAAPLYRRPAWTAGAR
ncbi:hypothetical protein [Streptomyces fuscigenes]|uniref:hypothetical protein n=1 Tax=Streptomyces fuscigenes TaxID=1528880 RepID=UPI001F3A7B08|nr:hypothetical protein [Streptomyces fuscigenes]MCF3960324.1 hypothetical protein [Streptomyces fuscigenes]